LTTGRGRGFPADPRRSWQRLPYEHPRPLAASRRGAPVSRRSRSPFPSAPLLLHRRPPALPELGELPAFSLTDQRGHAFGRDDLRGKVWVADFVFTSCSDACPRLTQRMRSLQDRIDPHEGVGLLSISVDPESATLRRSCATTASSTAPATISGVS